MLLLVNSNQPHMTITLFSQILQKISKNSIHNLAQKHDSNEHSKGNYAWSHFVDSIVFPGK